MGIKEKLANAKATRWPAEGFTDEEVSKIVGQALKNGRRMREKTQKAHGRQEMEVFSNDAETLYDRGRVNKGAHTVFFWKTDGR